MTGLRKILFALLAILGMLSAPGWTSAAAGCQVAASSRDSIAMSMPMPAHHQQHSMAASNSRQAPVKKPAQTPAPGDPRLACSACVGVLPPFPSMGRQELMPLVPIAEAFQPLSGFDPAIDPPPPRGEAA